MESVSIDATSVTFPALCIPRDFGVYLVRDVSQLRRVRAQPFWTHRHFAGLRICDSSGRAYEVRTADISSPTSRAGRFLARLLDLTIEVDVKLAPLDSAPLSDVVSAVRKALEVDPESFEELSQRSLEWWRTTLSRATSVPEIIRAFAECHPRTHKDENRQQSVDARANDVGVDSAAEDP